MEAEETETGSITPVSAAYLREATPRVQGGTPVSSFAAGGLDDPPAAHCLPAGGLDHPPAAHSLPAGGLDHPPASSHPPLFFLRRSGLWQAHIHAAISPAVFRPGRRLRMFPQAAARC